MTNAHNTAFRLDTRSFMERLHPDTRLLLICVAALIGPALLAFGGAS